jgi:hypothetical protein
MELMAYSPDGRYGYTIAPKLEYDIPRNLGSELGYLETVIAHGRLLEAPFVAATIPFRLFHRTYGFADQEQALYEIDLDHGSVTARREFIDPPRIDINAIAIAPGARSVALTTESGIHVIDLDSNADWVRLVHEGEGGPEVRSVCYSPDGKRIAGTNVGGYVWEIP